MTTKKSVKVDGEFLTSLFETKANEILAKESKKKATKKVSTEKSEVKDEKPKTKKTVKATKKADTETVKKDEKITKKPATKKVTKKAEKPAKEQAEKPKKVTKKAEKVEKVEQEHKQEKALRKITKSLKIAKSTYNVVEDITSYDELLKAVESERGIAVAFDCSEVSKSDYENIFHVPYVNMKDNFDVCEPIFIGEKVPRLVFASIYSEALWDLFPEEFELISAVLEK